MLKSFSQKFTHLDPDTKVYLCYHENLQKREQVDGISIIDNEIFVDPDNRKETSVTLRDLDNESLVISVDDGDSFREPLDLIEKDYGLLIITYA